MKKPIISIVVGIVVVVVIISILYDDNIPQVDELSSSESTLIENTASNSIFKTYAKSEFMLSNNTATRLEFDLRPELDKLYEEISPQNQNVIVIFPSFTLSAYSESGFYDYYGDKCDERCLEIPIRHDFEADFKASGNGYRTLKLLGYQFITDMDVDQKPEIIKKYDKVILLHNEYVTKNMFDAITSHPNVVYLYPNSLYAEVESDYQENTIKLIKGHGYPTSGIDNGFDWEYDNTHPYEFDIECIDWYFYQIENGIMLSCYPENLIYDNAYVLKAIRDSDNPFWHSINLKEIDDFSDDEWNMMVELFDLLPQ